MARNFYIKKNYCNEYTIHFNEKSKPLYYFGISEFEKISKIKLNDDYPLDKASESFDHLINSDHFDVLMGKKIKKSEEDILYLDEKTIEGSSSLSKINFDRWKQILFPKSNPEASITLTIKIPWWKRFLSKFSKKKKLEIELHDIQIYEYFKQWWDEYQENKKEEQK